MAKEEISPENEGNETESTKVSVFDRLGVQTARRSVFDRLKPHKETEEKAIRKPIQERRGRIHKSRITWCRGWTAARR